MVKEILLRGLQNVCLKEMQFSFEELSNIHDGLITSCITTVIDLFTNFSIKNRISVKVNCAGLYLGNFLVYLTRWRYF